jgi:hypothetical protein
MRYIMMNRIPHCRIVSLVLLITVAPLNAPLLAQPSNEQIDRAIQRAKEYLYSQQNEHGNWETTQQREPGGGANTASGQWGGLTAIATYALLASGESHMDPRLSKAIDFLIRAEMDGIYAVGMRAQIWNLLPKPPRPEVRAAIQRDHQIFMTGVRTKQGHERGMYHYVPSGGGYDHSVSQFGVLGVWALAQTNVVEVPPNYWRMVEEGWIRNQRPDGGWGYKHDGETRLSMAAAGVATLFITQDYLHAQAGAVCRGNLTNPAIEAAMKWVGDNAKDFRRNWAHYTLYGLERIGLASGYKYLGDVNWYAEGAEWLVRSQGDNGAWKNIPDTSFGLLFLVRGRQPVVMNKLAYDLQGRGDQIETGHWNQRPRDVANFTQWLSNLSERELHWQIVNLKVGAADLHDAPILYISGNQTLSFSQEEMSTLRNFVEEGGIILGNSDCTTAAFSNSFRKLGTDLFPMYEWRELPQDHIVYRNQFPRERWRTKPSVLALGNGAREFMFIAPQLDMGRHWQLRQQAGRDEVFQLPANIFFYATDRQNLPFKGESYVVAKDTKVNSDRTLRLARLQYPGNWNPEPGGWRRMANIMHNQHKVDLQVETVQLGEGKLEGFKVAHLTGTTTFSLSESARQELRQFVENGGVVIIDSAGGSGQFAASAETELQAIFGSEPRVLPPSHDLFAATGTRLEHFGYRTFALQALRGARGPQVRAIEQNGRIAALFSREDLTVGLVGQDVDGIYGYTPATATALMQNMLLHSMK